MLAGIVVTHARLAAALREAVVCVADDGRDLVAVTNEGCDHDSIRQRVHAALEGVGDQDCIVFVDFRGTCATAVLEVLPEFPRARVLAGVNLPMLVDFVLRRSDLGLDEMVERLKQRGVTSIQQLKGV